MDKIYSYLDRLEPGNVARIWILVFYILLPILLYLTLGWGAVIGFFITGIYGLIILLPIAIKG